MNVPLAASLTVEAAALTLTLRRGALYLPRAVIDRYFAGVAAVVVLDDGADLLVLPVRHAAAGGYVLKVRNAAGDRVVDAPDLLRAHRLDEIELQVSACWDERRAGLLLTGLLAPGARDDFQSLDAK
jgi:hypothetical protein